MKLKYYTVIVINDCEGRTTKSIANFYNEHDAISFAQSKFGRDMYGQPGRVEPVILSIFKDIVEAIEESNTKLLEHGCRWGLRARKGR